MDRKNKSIIQTTHSIPLNLDRVWDFATQTWTRVVNIDVDAEDGYTTYDLADNVPLTPEYPDRNRNRCEIGNSWRDPHGHIYHGNETIQLIKDPNTMDRTITIDIGSLCPSTIVQILAGIDQELIWSEDSEVRAALLEARKTCELWLADHGIDKWPG